MSYYLEDHPNLSLAQFGWPRTRVSGVIGVHTTESGVYFDGPDPGVENTAAYIGRRTNHGSYHVMGDADSRLKMVRPRYAAWADTTNNAHAMSVAGAMDAARWRDLSPERAAAITRNMGIAAAELVQDAIADGLLDSPPPARRITAAEAIAGTKPGFYGHGETNPGTRYDPGQNFDWDLFLSTYAAAIGGTINYQSTSNQEGFLMALTDKQQEDLHYVLCTDEGRQIHAQKFADVVFRTTLGMLDGGKPTFGELLAVSNDRLGHIKRGTDLLPALDADFRGEFDIQREYRAAQDGIVSKLSALLTEKPVLTEEDVRGAVASAIADGITLTVKAGEK